MKKLAPAVVIAAALAAAGPAHAQDAGPRTHIALEAPAAAPAIDAGPASGIGTSPSVAAPAQPDPAAGIGTSPSADDAGGLALALYRALQRGETLPAVALGLMLVALALRKLGGGVLPWLKTKPGGYTVAFGSSLLVYAGTALLASSPVTGSLVLSWLAASYAAAGGWEALRDFLGWLKAKAS